MNKEWIKVKEFHEKFGHPTQESPTMLTEDRSSKRYKWMLEEIDEFISSNDVYEQADAMIDLIYFALGTLVEMGIEPDKIFSIVHEANMSKLWSDGKPHYDAEGKTIKPSHWENPYPKLKLEIDNQLK